MDKVLNKRARAVYEALEQALKVRPNLAPSQQELSDKTGIDISSVNDAIALLEAAGYVGKLGRVPRSLYIVKKMPRAKVS